eukprot:7387908-Prymnesium_polylepis.1
MSCSARRDVGSRVSAPCPVCIGTRDANVCTMHPSGGGPYHPHAAILAAVAITDCGDGTDCVECQSRAGISASSASRCAAAGAVVSAAEGSS